MKYQKMFFVVALVISSISTTLAQQGSKRDFMFGVGFGNAYNSGIGSSNDGIDTQVPNILFGADYAVSEAGPGRITSGWILSGAHFTGDGDLIPEDFNFTTAHIEARAGYALFPLLEDKLEPYGGLAFSYNAVFYSDDAIDVTTDTDFGVYVGARFLPTKDGKLGIFGEFGTGFTTFRLGISFRKPQE